VKQIYIIIGVMRIFFVDDFSLALYNKLYGMKANISITILLILGVNSNLKAQWNDYSFYYNSIDSINTTSIMRANEDSANYYLHLSNFHLVAVNKITNNIDTILQEYLSNIFIDSAGTLWVSNNNSIKSYQNNTWQTLAIPNGYVSAGCIVDSSGAICFKALGDSLFKYKNNNWVKVKLNFPGSNEHIAGVISGPHHECLVYSNFNSLLNIYQIQGANLNLSYQLPPVNYFKFDDNGRIWYMQSGELKYMETNGNIVQVPLPNSVTVFDYVISDIGNKIWLVKLNGPNELFYFDGANWQSVFATNKNLGLFKTKGSKIYLFQNNSFYQTENAVLRVFEDTTLIKKIAIGKPFVAAEVTSILVDDSYNGNGQNDYILGTKKGLVVKKDYSDLFNTWDTLNSAMPSNCIYSLGVNHNSWFWGVTDTLLIGTDKGLIKAGVEYNDSLNIYQVYNTQNSDLPSDTITSIVTGNEYFTSENIWLGTLNKGAAMLDANGSFTLIDTSNSLLPSNNIININYSNNFVGIATDHGFMTIIDTVQQVYTMTNSGLLTEDVNFVAIYNSYYPGNGVYKYDLIVGTNGFGFAIIDTSNQWHYFNVTNGNFNSDTVYYLKDNVDLYGRLIGTENGIYQIANDLNNPIFAEIVVQNIGSDYRNKKADGCTVLCGSEGYRFVSLGDNGVTRFQVCYGSVNEKANEISEIKSWFYGNQLYYESVLNGSYKLDIFDLVGRNIYNCNVMFPNKSSVIIPQINEGIYLVKFSSGNQSFSSKVIHVK
jgi:ligand-binding sensor domain-containing protein